MDLKATTHTVMCAWTVRSQQRPY